MQRTIRRIALIFHEHMTRRHILSRLEDLNRTQWLSRDEILAIQSEKLIKVLKYANQYVPYYQRIFRETGIFPGDISRDLTILEDFPILTKKIIRENWNDLLTTEPIRRQQLSKLSTSGSTGEPLVFMQDMDFRDAVTADIQRHIGWAGWKLGDPQAFIWGAKSQSGMKQQIRLRLIDWVWNRYLINAFTMTEEFMANFARKIIENKPRILFGYASSIYEFAIFVRKYFYDEIAFDGVFSSAELLINVKREIIEDTFHCKVFDRYGTLDLGGVACECSAHNGLHISTENNYVEILNNGKPIQPGKVGDIIVTNLNNLGMPFIRYSIGDIGSLKPDNKCPCGRTSPMMGTIEGRIVDSFRTRDGRIVWSGFAGAGYRCLTHPSIKQFQVVQKSLDRILVRLVENEHIPQPVLYEITQAIRTSYGNHIVVDFEVLDEIAPLPSGKHRYAYSEINDNPSSR